MKAIFLTFEFMVFEEPLSRRSRSQSPLAALGEPLPDACGLLTPLVLKGHRQKSRKAQRTIADKGGQMGPSQALIVFSGDAAVAGGLGFGAESVGIQGFGPCFQLARSKSVPTRSAKGFTV